MKEYIEQKLEPRMNIFKKAPEDLTKRLTDSKIGDNGELNFEKKGLHFNFKYRTFEDTDPYVQWKIAQGIEKPGYWKILENLTIKDSTQKLELEEYLKLYNVRFSEEADEHHFNPADRKIIEMGNILTPRSILELLHEIGHFVYRDSLKESNPQKFKELKKASLFFINDIDNNLRFSIDKKQLEQLCGLKLEEERNAWAFALKKLKPFIKKDGLFTKEDILNYIHNVALQTYSRSIGSKTNSFISALIDSVLSNLAYKKGMEMQKDKDKEF